MYVIQRYSITKYTRCRCSSTVEAPPIDSPDDDVDEEDLPPEVPPLPDSPDIQTPMNYRYVATNIITFQSDDGIEFYNFQKFTKHAYAKPEIQDHELLSERCE